MVLQAWGPREEALRREEGGQGVVVPRIVERFREKMKEVARAEVEKAGKQVETGQQGQQQELHLGGTAAAAEVVDVGGLMGVGFGGYGGMMFGMDGQQGGYVEPGLMGGFPNAGLLGQFPLDVGMGQMNWGGMDWGFWDGRGG